MLTMWIRTVGYINQVVQDYGLYYQGGSGPWAIFTSWFRTVGCINKVVQDLGIY